MSQLDAETFRTRLERLEALLRESERTADPAVRAQLRELVAAILDLHAAGLGRMIELVSSAERGAGSKILDQLASDSLVGGMLLLHGLHPRSLADRVADALDRVRTRLRSHGEPVELLEIEEGIVRLRLNGHGDACPSSTAALRRAVEEAIEALAPDVAAIEFEEEPALTAGVGGRSRVPLPIL